MFKDNNIISKEEFAKKKSEILEILKDKLHEPLKYSLQKTDDVMMFTTQLMDYFQITYPFRETVLHTESNKRIMKRVYRCNGTYGESIEFTLIECDDPYDFEHDICQNTYVIEVESIDVSYEWNDSEE